MACLLKPLAGRVIAKPEPTELFELWGSDANVPGHMKRQRLQLWGGHLEPASNHAAYDVELSARLRWPMDRLREIGKARGAVAARCDCEVGNSAARQAMTHRAASRIETAMPMRRRCRARSAPEHASMMTSPTTSHMISLSLLGLFLDVSVRTRVGHRSAAAAYAGIRAGKPIFWVRKKLSFLAETCSNS